MLPRGSPAILKKEIKRMQTSQQQKFTEKFFLQSGQLLIFYFALEWGTIVLSDKAFTKAVL